MIYIDTGAFLARHLSRDQYHGQANSFWNSIKKKGEACTTSNFVLDETFTLLGRRAGYDFAAQRARNIYASEWLKILRSEKNDELRAIDYFEKYSDHCLSFTDCISIALMQRKKIKRVFTFDHHFLIFGFNKYPKNI
ncbi:MAG: PIN domain-containing protein [Desulfobacterales bacterium]